MITNIMHVVETQLDARLKKPFVSKNYTENERKNLFLGIKIALENAKIQQPENINLEQIFAIFKAMKPDIQSGMKYATRRGGVSFLTHSNYITQEGLLETLNWLDDYQGGYGPRFELLNSNNKLITYAPTIAQLRTTYQCDSNIALAATLYPQLKDKQNKLRIIPIFDSLNPLVDKKELTLEEEDKFADYEQRSSQYKFFDVVKPTLQKLINEFNEKHHPSIEDIAGFIKGMILLHPFTDGNGRTFTLGVLNQLLYKYNYGLCLYLDPYTIPLSSVSELENKIRDNLIPLDQFTQTEEIALTAQQDAQKDDDMVVSQLPVLLEPTTQTEEIALIAQEDDDMVVSQLPVLLEPNIIKLQKAIKKMGDYGQKLLDGGSDKGRVAINLAKELEKQLDTYLGQKNQTLSEYHQFKSTFSKTLHSQDTAFSEHRFYSAVVVKNVAIALTGIGLLVVVGKLLTSYYTTGQAVGFFSKTQRQENSQDIDEQLEKMIAPAA